MEPLTIKEKLPSVIFLLIFVLLAAGILIGGYFAYRNYEQNYLREVEHLLSSTAELKVNQLVQWRKERLGDANIFYQNNFFSEHVKHYFKNQNDTEAKKRIQNWMDQIASAFAYNRICLHDDQGVERISVPKTKIHPPSIFSERSAEALKSCTVIFQDFYRDENDQQVYLNLFVPVLDETDNSKALGVVSMRIDPTQYLYPMIEKWPTPNKSSETLIIRRDGNDALFLNALHFHKDAALALRIPLDSKDIPAVRAALGEEGIVEGTDYRGVPVIADVRAVPDSPWFLVAKMDIEEVYAPIRERAWLMIFLVGTLLLGSGASVGLVWRQQRSRFYQERYEAAEALRDSENRYRRLFEAARDGILILDAQTGMIADVNPFLIEMLGYTHDQFLGKKVWELGFLKDIITSEEKFQELQQKEYVRYDDLPLATSDGLRIDVEFVSNVYLVDHHKVIQCNIRDITERKQAENIIQARLRLVEFAAHHSLDELLTKTLDEVCAITNSPIGFYHFVEPDQKTLSLQAWSTRTMQEYCKAEGKGLHYGVDRAGVWVDCISARKPVIHNDYASLPHKKGLPEGHAALIRELVVPIFREGKIVAILGIGNKARDYIEKDIDTVAYFADVAWEITERKRAEDDLKQMIERFDLSTRAGRMGVWDWDVQKNRLIWDDRMYELYGIEKQDFTGAYEAWLNGIHPDDAARSEEESKKALSGEKEYDTEFRVVWPDKTVRHLKAYAQVVRDSDGKPLRMTGINYDITEQRLAEEKLKSLLKEKEVLIREVHHRVKNNFAVVSSLLSLQSRDIKDNAVQEMFMISRDRINSMALLHERLYQSQDLTHIHIAEYIRTLAADLYRAYETDPERVSLVTEVEDVLLDVDKVVPCGLIVNELISNALKYGFPKSRKGKGQIKVTLRKINGNEVELTVMDNGAGLPEDFDIHQTQSLGLKLVTMLAEGQLGGKLRVSREGGAKFQIQFSSQTTRE